MRGWEHKRMLIQQYLRRNLLRTFFITLSVLLSIFFAQQLIYAFNLVSRGSIPVSFTFKLIALNMPFLANYLLPLAIFIAVLLTFIRLYLTSEVVVMFACGVSPGQIRRAIWPLALVLTGLSLANTLYISPYTQTKLAQQISFFRTNPTFSLLKPGSFNSLPGNYVLFVESISGSKANNIYFFNLKAPQADTRVALLETAPNQQERQKSVKIPEQTSNQISDQAASIAVEPEVQALVNQGSFTYIKAAQSSIEVIDNQRVITLQDGILFTKQGLTQPSLAPSATAATQSATDFYQISFKNVSIMLDLLPNDLNLDSSRYKTLPQLLKTRQGMLEVLVRVLNALSVLLLSMLAFVFGRVNSRQGRSANLISAALLYFVYFFVLNSLMQVVNRGSLIGPVFYLYLSVNLLYLLFIFFLLSQNHYVRNWWLTRRLTKFFVGVG